MKKKLFAFFMAMTMILSLAACGGDDSGKGAAAVDTSTVAVGAVVIARDDIPEDDIYAFTSAIFENIETITEQHAKGGELDLDFASSVTSVPYHPGAAKYFAEKGKEVASVKEGAGSGSSKALTFGTGGESGTYYAFGGVLSSYVSNNTGVTMTALTSGGSQANIEDLSGDNVQLAFVQSDVMSYAYNGERLFDAPVAGFSVVAAQVKKLAEEIKGLAGEVDSGIDQVEERAGELSGSLSASQQVLGQGTSIVGAAEGLGMGSPVTVACRDSYIASSRRLSV